MRIVFTALALLVGYGAWCVAPAMLDRVGLGWTADLGQLCATILAISVLGKLEARWTDTRHG